MNRTAKAALAGLLASLLGAATADAAVTPRALLQQWRVEAGANGPPFDAARGRRLFETTPGDWSCSSCHTRDPRAAGRHVVTGKPISPLAPSANPARFTDEAKVAKWMRRNCRDVLGRECSAAEKGDLLTWILSLK